MAELTLVIANKSYSSWSLRPWIAMTHAGIPFDEQLIPFDRPDTRALMLAHSPSGKVPCLVDGVTRVWESLAILEYLAERFPDAQLWPRQADARAYARAISAEMHAGFHALRTQFPMNLRRKIPGHAPSAATRADVDRIEALWREGRSRFGGDGPFLLGAFGAADAMYAPVVTRLDTYDITVADDTRLYMNAVLALPAFTAWKDAALAEPWIVPDDEID